ncbi:hypothetical protein [Spirosoma validum]|uniref:Uncharacterized protein n=1 Tax=Spirosoma validum TaxID=2771355 RepID=A0A927B235_9BACT|nr:hypothetical protein [Spirosoma validum]MBD2753822.1 hypothetical protein [Spirosoma validum]
MNQDFTPMQCLAVLAMIAIRLILFCAALLNGFFIFIVLRELHWTYMPKVREFIKREIGAIMPMAIILFCLVGIVVLLNWLDAMGFNWVNNTHRY